jgi:DNA-binding IscR family transcriptional regulator
LWRKECDGIDPCTIHEQWAEVMTKVYAFLQQTTLEALAETEGLAVIPLAAVAR